MAGEVRWSPSRPWTPLMAPATLHVVKGLDKAAARAPPDLVDESAGEG